MLIIGTTSPTNPPAKTSLNDYEQQQQQHDDLISKILPSSSQNNKKKNHIPTSSSSSSSSSWLRTEHYKLTTAKQENLQYVESTGPRNEELREKGISQNLSIVSFDFCPCLARECKNRKRKRKGKKKRVFGGKLINGCFFLHIYLLRFTLRLVLFRWRGISGRRGGGRRK